MKSSFLLKGTGTALITPFQDDYSVDYKSLEKIVETQIKGGINYLVVMGTTGESVTLDKSEKSAILSCVIKKSRNRVPIVLGIGGNNTAEVVQSLRSADLEGVHSILSVAPYYNKPNQEGLFRHFCEVSKASPKPVILYNVPGRTGSNMMAETTLRIAENCPNVIGIKEASGNMDQIMSIIKNRRKDFLVISGDDSITLPLMAAGADGVISVVSNAYPKAFSEMVRCSIEGNWIRARKLHYDLFDLIPLLFAEGSPSGIKFVMENKGLCKSTVRLPLAGISKGLQEKIKKTIK
jgi:4-hydroxy-tetrahydrodipicolinate synthase